MSCGLEDKLSKAYNFCNEAMQDFNLVIIQTFSKRLKFAGFVVMFIVVYKSEFLYQEFILNLS
ncbi:hypothetical protein LEP1GSC021_0858 [Leptospira noguchii str. 1993005606]|uniref:Uncharacterized protein n=1 Tax=Leptospira noguchii str. 2001034031 TaxID=1193053 RepID=M6Y0P3_9LEPT|nr:hypothetical protein LEP1GSC041_4163 [Leptospira noguchii str. 2006001870]EMO87897.1 hypothetical protein LEP1GSC024_2767 [Leptospira noguchii str. 2001034031]EPE82785.1 hypothetical protein LEP1GSC021_0858 [Leptospira noguchii str. 1993005606]TQE64951.1 hypothetical protein FF021_19550 [Leptospira noguchii]